MSAKGDARSERPSRAQALVRAGWGRTAVAGLVFGAFLLLHLGLEAVRALREAVPSGAEIETTRAPVIVLSIVVACACLGLATRTRAREDASSSERTREARSLGLLERFAQYFGLTFLAAHLWQFAWPLVTGAAEPEDLRPALVASLSSTQAGLPLVATSYALAVAASSFFATRAVLRAHRTMPTSARRVVVALGALAYVLGSYAVIRGAGGAFLP